MFRKLTFLKLAIAALCFVTDQELGGPTEGSTEGGGFASAAAARTEKDHTAAGFTPFREWANRQITAANCMVKYDGRDLKVGEILDDGRVRLLDNGANLYVPFDQEIIEQLLPLIT
jgi:hypothetical protein